MKRLLILGALVAWALSTVTVLATPGSGVTVNTILAQGIADPIATAQAAGRDSVIQDLTIAPGGHTGWHSHPGGTVIIVESGVFSFYDSTCAQTDVAAGRTVVEPGGGVQLARNNGAADLVLTVIYLDITSPDGPLRTDATAPACAAGAGLPTTATGLNTTPAIVDRATFASAATITGGDERAVVVQQVSFAPGGHTGWHSHPGATQIFVVSGTFSFYSATCTRQDFTAGQGAIEPGGGVQLARNESTTEPLNLFVVYYDVPPGVPGGFRVDSPEPATCQGLIGNATPAPATPTTAASALPTTAASALPNTSAQVAVGGSGAPAPLVIAVLLALASIGGLVALRWSRVRG